MSHLADRFIAAVRICTSSQPVKKRLTDAWLSQLDDLTIDELPDQLHADFISLRKAMYEHTPQPKEAAPIASVRKMSAGQATRYTAMIVKMLGEVLRIKYASTRADTAVGTLFEAGQDTIHEPGQRLN